MHLGIDIGGTNLKTGIIDNNGELIYKNSRKTNSYKGFEQLLQVLINLIDDTLTEYSSIKTIGIGVPGVINNEGIVVIAPNLPGWKNIQLRKILKDRFALPLAIENDANVAAFAELIDGSGKDKGSFFYLTLGTGVGGTIIHNGSIFRGETGGAGEIGHIIIDYKNALSSDNFRDGTLENLTGKDRIIELGKENAESNPSSMMNDFQKLDVRNISYAADVFDSAATDTLKKIGEYLGIGLVSALNLLDIHLVVVGEEFLIQTKLCWIQLKK
jgi:glucokinase